MRLTYIDLNGWWLQRSRLAAFTALVALSVAVGTATGGATQTCSVSSIGGRCFQVETTPDTWWQANRTCIAKGGTLAAIKTQDDKNAVEMFGRSLNNIPVWTGGHVKEYAWRWNGLRHRGLHYQGCYKDRLNDPDLDVLIEMSSSLTPSDCAERCIAAQQNYEYSSVQFNSNNQIVCRCGKTFNKYGPERDPMCERPCPPPTQDTSTYDWRERENLERFCGNPGAQIVTRVWGLLFHYWVRPRDQGDNECAALDYARMFRWKDFHCNDARLSHICEYDTSSSNCLSPKIWISSRGVCFSKHTDSKNWYEAFRDCRQRGGYLLEIRDHLVQQYLNENLMGSGERYWIALKRRTWQWRDGTKVEAFVDWKDGEPKVTDKNKYRCILMKPSSYKWSSEDCNLRHPFVCEYINGPDQTAPTPSPSPVPVQSPAPAPAPAPSTTPTPNQPNTSPDGQQGQQQLNPAIIGGAAGGGGLFLIIVIGIIAYCCCCKKTKRKGTMKKAKPPPAKSRTQPVPHPPTSSGHDNRAFSTREKGGHHGKGKTHKSSEQAHKSRHAKANTYVSKPPEKPQDANYYLSLQSPEPEKANVYEELIDEPKYTDDGYLYMKTPQGPDKYENTKQNPAPYDNYAHYMKPRQ